MITDHFKCEVYASSVQQVSRATALNKWLYFGFVESLLVHTACFFISFFVLVLLSTVLFLLPGSEKSFI